MLERRLKNMQEDDILVCNDSYLYILAFKLDLKFRRQILLIRNKYNNDLMSRVESDVECFSFDIEDCSKYNLKYYRQYCSGYAELVNQPSRKINDRYNITMYFLGLNKGRTKWLNYIKSISGGVNHKFLVKYQSNLFIRFICVFFKVEKYTLLSYKEHLDNVNECNIIVDIVQEGQSGYTMRTIESLLARKKLITNNKNVISEDFYDPNRILVLSGDESIDAERICEFLDNIEQNEIATAVDFSTYSIVHVFEKILKIQVFKKN
ncbi:hypothetical protein [Vibrio breoganii]|uniref:Uncharacterized protein n=1 Tax=Vibrio breoganii TaxID=553239 RepID=A0ABX1UBU0_9VIBR|nr:hypothetical protein [Vibrio breoganii]NMO74826.1 hypothetical protein [Vibrio breoganii]NMR71938.1 hypothetical protein [Vibrio breoganii]